MNPTWSRTPASAAAAIAASVSASVSAMGFSHRMSLPALAAARIQIQVRDPDELRLGHARTDEPGVDGTHPPGTHEADPDALSSHGSIPLKLRVHVEVVADPLQHEAGRFDRAFLPGEDTAGQDAVEADPPECREAGVPVHLTLSDVQVLMYPRRGPGRVDDVAQAGRGAMVEDVGDVHLPKDRRGVLDHRPDVIAEVERVGRTEKVADVR